MFFIICSLSSSYFHFSFFFITFFIFQFLFSIFNFHFLYFSFFIFHFSFFIYFSFFIFYFLGTGCDGRWSGRSDKCVLTHVSGWKKIKSRPKFVSWWLKKIKLDFILFFCWCISFHSFNFFSFIDFFRNFFFCKWSYLHDSFTTAAV